MFDVLLYPSSMGELEIKTMQKGGDTLFLLPDVVQVISQETQSLDGRATSNQASLLKASITSLEDDERFIETVIVDGKEERHYYVTEPGVYRVAMQAKSSGAKKFQNWVLKEVMPSIRRFGIYPPPEVNDDDFLLQVADQQAKQSQLLSQFMRSSMEKFKHLDNKVDEQSNTIKLQGSVLQSLKERLDTVELNNHSNLEYFDVSEVIRSLEIDESKLTLVVAQCEKVASEKRFNYQVSLSGIREEQRFPMAVIKLALIEMRLISGDSDNA